MRKIAVFSDIHGNYQALKSIIEDIDRDNFDDVICLGDTIAIGPDSIVCLETIMNSNIKMVLGNHEVYQIKDCEMSGLSDEIKNHEKWVLGLLEDKHKEYLSKLPLSYDILEDGHLLTFCHFLIDDEKDDFYPLSIVKDGKINDILKDSTFDYLFFGHEHNNFDIHLEERFFSCIGSSGCVRGNTTFYTVIEIDEDFVKINKKYVQYDRKDFEKTMKSSEYPEKEYIQNTFFGVN